MAKKRTPEVLTFGLDKKIRDSTSNVIDKLSISKSQILEFRISFDGPALYLWLVDSEGKYSPLFSSAQDTGPDTPLGMGQISLEINPGEYLLDCNTFGLSNLNVRIVK